MSQVNVRIYVVEDRKEPHLLEVLRALESNPMEMSIVSLAETITDNRRFSILDGKVVLIIRPSFEAVAILKILLRSSPIYSCCRVRVFGEKTLELEPIDWGRCSSTPGLI